MKILSGLDCETTVNTFTVHNELLYIQIAIWDLKEFYTIENYRQLRTSLPEIHIINASDTTDEMKQLLRGLLQDENQNVVFFNAPFDLAHLLKWLYPDVFFSGMNLFTYSQDYINCKIWDLYLISKIIHSGYKKNSLADWTRRLACGQSIQKSFKKNFTLTAEQEVYMKKDVEVMMYIFLQLRIENYSWFNSFEAEKTSDL